MEGGVQDVGIRAAEQALDAALAEHRRAVRLAADARERERIARSHEVKAAAAACTGLKPTAMSMTAVMATGAPKPASASISAPNENAMMTAWMRWSSEIEANERRSTAKCPVASVML